MTPQFNYKIFDKKNKKFFSANRKSTWTQKAAVINFINEKIRVQKQVYSGYRTAQPVYTLDDIDIYIYPVENAIIKSSSDFLNDNKEETNAKIAKKLETERKHAVARKKSRVEQLEKELKETQTELNRLKK